MHSARVALILAVVMVLALAALWAWRCGKNSREGYANAAEFTTVWQDMYDVCETGKPVETLFAKHPSLTTEQKAQFKAVCRPVVNNTPPPFKLPSPPQAPSVAGMTPGKFYFFNNGLDGGVYYGNDGLMHLFVPGPTFDTKHFVTKAQPRNQISSEDLVDVPWGNDFLDLQAMFAQNSTVTLPAGTYFVAGPSGAGSAQELVIPPNARLQGAGQKKTFLRIVGRGQIKFSAGSVMADLTVDANGADRMGEPPSRSAGTLQTGKYITPIGAKEAHGGQMIRCTLTGSGDYGMTIGKSKGFKVLDCRFYGIQRIALLILQCTNTRVNLCHFEYVGCDGISDESDGTIISRCFARNIGAFQFKTDRGCAFVYATGSKNLTVALCDISGCGANSIDAIECDNVIVRNNKIARSGAVGIGLFGAHKALVEKNTITDCNLRMSRGFNAGIGVTISRAKVARASKDVTIRDNTVRGCKFGLSWEEQTGICNSGDPAQYDGNIFGRYVGRIRVGRKDPRYNQKSQWIVTSFDAPPKQCAAAFLAPTPKPGGVTPPPTTASKP